MSMADVALLDRWQRQRDADAFAELVHRYSGVVFAACRRTLGDAACAEDVAQDSFVELMQTRDRIRVSLGAWLHTIAVRRCLDRAKGETRRRAREWRFAEARPDAVDASDASEAELFACVDEAIEELPVGLRAVVVARFLEAESHTAMARRLGVTESTVRYRVERGVARIRQTLARRGVPVGMAVLTSVLDQTVEAAPPTLAAKVCKLAVAGSIPPVAATGLLAGIGAIPAFKIAAVILVVLAAGIGVKAGHDFMRDRGADSLAGGRDATAMVPQASEAGANAGHAQPALTSQPDAAAPSTPTEPQDYSIQGRVYDSKSGEGIAGVRVSVFPSGGGAQKARSEPTGPSGDYTLPPLADGMYSIQVELDKAPEYPDVFRNKHKEIAIQGTEPVTGVDFALDKGIRVAGMVFDTNNKPVSAEVGAKTKSVPNPLRVKSDQDGRFALYMPEPADDLMLQAQNDGAESATQSGVVLTKDGIEGVVLILDQPRTAAISGVVTDRAGAGIDGAQLHLLHKSQRVFGYGGDGVADRDGKFRIGNCAAGEYALIVTPKEAQGFTTSEEYMRLTLAPGQNVDGLQILYGEKGGLAIAGRVLDSAGKPIAGARVQCFGGPSNVAYTKSDGTFIVTGLEEKEYGVCVEHDDYSRTDKSILAGTFDAEIVLKGRAILKGRVVRADTGAPLTTYTLAFLIGEARSLDEQLFSSGRPVESADGSFSFDKIHAGSVTVAAWAPGFAPSWRVLNVDEGADAPVELQLSAVPRFEGVVLDEALSPVAEAGVYFVEGVALDRMDKAAAARTDASGRFTLDSLPPDATQVCAYHPGYGVGVVATTGAMGGPVASTGDHRIILPAPAIVKGTIVSEGAVFSDVLVNASYPEARHLPYSYTRPNDDGTFLLTCLSPGEIRILVYPNGGVRHCVARTVLLGKGQTIPLDFTFEKGAGIVEGTLDVAGEAVSNAFLRLERRLSDRTESLEGRPDPSGNYHFDAVWAGSLTLVVTRVDSDNPYDPINDEFPISIGDGERLRQDLHLPAMP